jgi:hypothetical protein
MKISRLSLVCLAAAALLCAPTRARAQDPTLANDSISTSGSTCATATACVGFDVADLPSVTLYLTVGVSGTFNWEASLDATSNSTGVWFAVSDDVGAATSATTGGVKYFTTPYRRFRVRASAISGAATIVAFRGQHGLRVAGTFTGSSAAVGVTGAAVPSSADFLGLNIGGNLVGITGFSLGSARAGAMAIVDGSGNQITSFGGGTQYATGTATATPTGTVALGYDGANERAIKTDTGGQQYILAASGALASGSVASGAIASGAVASGAFASGSISDGAEVTLGAKADAKSTATDTTAVTVMSVLKEISAMEQAPASRAVTNAGTFATQSAITAASGSVSSGAFASGSIASGAVASGAFASGALASGSVADGAMVTLGSKADAKSTATDTTSVTIMSVLKEISAMVQAPASTPVTNTGTFATQAAQSGTWTVQPGNTANTTAWLVAGGKTNNNAAPGATNIGALIGVANAAAPTYTETDMVLASLDLHGSTRVTSLDSGGTSTTDATAHANKVEIVDTTGAAVAAATLATHDGALGTITSVTGGISMGRASAAVPSDVSADGDAAALWVLRSGALGIQPTFGGVLATTGNGVSGTGVQRVTLASDGTGVVGLSAGTNYVGKIANFADGTLVSGAITSAMTGTTSTSLVSGTASNYLYITSCSAGNDHATVDTYISLQDGSGGTTLAQIFVPHGGGNNYTPPVPLKVPTSGNALFAANVTTGSSTKISCNGYKSTTSF